MFIIGFCIQNCSIVKMTLYTWTKMSNAKHKKSLKNKYNRNNENKSKPEINIRRNIRRNYIK